MSAHNAHLVYNYAPWMHQPAANNISSQKKVLKSDSFGQCLLNKFQAHYFQIYIKVSIWNEIIER